MLALSIAVAAAAPSAAELDELDLEDLMRVVVTSVSKRPQTLAETAAAAYVIHADDIRRSGARNIPEALRLAPGIQVSAIGNNKWAVSIRGFADRYSNKLLVMVDGRSVYTPLFSGVLWETLAIPLEEITRIEVIRGPGASVWGANAVNGVINIITRSPFDAQGGQVSVAGGSDLKARGYARYGWSPSPDTALSVHVAAHDYDPSQQLDGRAGVDDWQHRSASFKLEHLLDRGTLQVQAGVSGSEAGDEIVFNQISPITRLPDNPLVQATQKVDSGHLLARWEADFGQDRRDSLRFSLERSHFEHVALGENRTTADLEYQQLRQLGERHTLTWGLGYRYSTDKITNSDLLRVGEPKRDNVLYSAYAQDDISLVAERWRLSLGARLEHNDYTGVVFQPNLRLLWTPDPANSVWLSLARAVRTPSRIERGGLLNATADPSGAACGSAPFPCLVQLRSERLDNEELSAVDLGWRHQINRDASLDLAAFYYSYDHLRGASTTAAALLPPGYLLVENRENNANSADLFGLEINLDWRPLRDWRLQTNYSWFDERFDKGPLPLQLDIDYAGKSSRHQFSVFSSLNLSPALSWDAWLRHTGGIRNANFVIPAFTTMDMRLAWKVDKDLELSLVGQNLLGKAHPEFEGGLIQSTPSEIQRGFYVGLDWRF